MIELVYALLFLLTCTYIGTGLLVCMFQQAFIDTSLFRHMLVTACWPYFVYKIIKTY